MSLQEKYQTLLELANSNGTTYELSEGDGVLHITGSAPDEAAKAALWAEYERIDPDFRSSDLILNITTAAAAAGGDVHTYTVVSGDNLTKIGNKYGIPWKSIWDHNRDILNHPDKIYPGQELKIPQ
ncbi:MAG: LysM peptidoglycan-binding domain-containing protein [Pyrinomonadaceae bacterium]|jgi:nucleoid-associated protein YgaU|nr:LysM peptidoglycan-binding domain-containing protein [Blastocatellia bacterium]MCW5956526.1 LysM peptidoglycan-binding domain-containing protein [Pyrinomonadaceae bacterium]